MSKLCQSCYHENVDIAIYCAKCGNKIKIKYEKKESNEPSDKENIDTELKDNIILGIWGTVILLIIIFIIFNISNKFSEDKKYHMVNHKAKIIVNKIDVSEEQVSSVDTVVNENNY